MLKKKILHIAEPFATGVLSFLVDITRRQVVEYDIYILWGQRELTTENVEKLFDPRIKLIKIESFNGALGTVLNPKAYKEVRHWYNKIKPDIVHMHSSASGFVGRWALPVSKVKAFYTPHGYSFLMQGGMPLKKCLFYALEWITSMRPALTVACGKGEYKEALKLPGKKSYVTNGIKTDGMEGYVHFVPLGEGVRSSSDTNGYQATVVTSGRILKQKNPAFFNEVAKLVPEVKFVWIGSGDLDKELTAENIEVPGWVKREEALNVISEAHFFILTSLWEGLPLCLLEGMYLKKMCLATNVIGNRDAIVDGVNGFICETPIEMAEKLRECISGKVDIKEAMAEAAHRDIVENYNVDKMAEAYEKLYISGNNMINPYGEGKYVTIKLHAALSIDHRLVA